MQTKRKMPKGVTAFSVKDSLFGKNAMSQTSSYLECLGYRYVEVPSLMPASFFEKVIEGTENRMFKPDDNLALAPEVANHFRNLGPNILGARKVYYAAMR